MTDFDTVYALRCGHGSLSSGTAVYLLDPEANLVALRSDLTKIYDMPLDNLVALRPRTFEVNKTERDKRKVARQHLRKLRQNENHV